MSTCPSRVAENSSRWPGWHAVQQPGDGGQEAHVGHVVGLVEHRDVDGVQRAGALAHQVLAAASGWPPRRRRCRAGVPRPAAGATPRRRRSASAGRARRPGGGARRGPGWAVPRSGPAPGREAARPACRFRWPSGSATAARSVVVLPEPVSARPRTSRPASPSGRVWAWMGAGRRCRGRQRRGQGRGDAQLGKGASGLVRADLEVGGGCGKFERLSVRCGSGAASARRRADDRAGSRRGYERSTWLVTTARDRSPSPGRRYGEDSRAAERTPRGAIAARGGYWAATASYVGRLGPPSGPG